MQYTAHVNWTHSSDLPFTTKAFDRTHHIHFGSGPSLSASSAPEFAGNAALVNPEELFTAAIASCFMLTFLYHAAMKNVPVAEYSCEATGVLGKNAEGKMAMTEVILKPRVHLTNHQSPDTQVFNELLKKAHEHCFISCSVNTKVTVQAEG